MLFLYFVVMAEQIPFEEIKLDNLGMYLSRIGYGKVWLERDGTFLAASHYHIWHWDTAGRLINRMGGKGEGPGEFQGVGEVIWNGDYYWAIDNQRLISTIFDAEGRYLTRKPIYYRQFVRLEDQIFALDVGKFAVGVSEYPPLLQEINYRIKDGELEVEHTGFNFKKVTPKQVRLNFNFKLLWAVREADRYLVVDQLEPIMRIYDPATRKREREIGNNQPFEPNFMPMELKSWEDPPDSWTQQGGTARDFRQWWQSWSRINYFGKAGDDYVVAYEIPNEEDPESSLQAVQRIAKDGHAIGEPLIIQGYCMGSRDNKVYMFHENEDSEKFEYYVRIYRF